MKRLLLLLLPLILTACIRVRIERVVPTETPTPEMLIVRRTDPTREPTNTPYIAPIVYTVTAAAIPERYPTSTPMAQAQDSNIIIVNKYRLEMIGYRTGTDYFTDNKYIELSYRFTNNSDSGASFGWNVFTSAFQDGIELPTHYVYDSEKFTEIKPGVSIIVKDGFDLRNNSPIQLEYSTLFSDAVTRTVTFR